MLLNEIKPSAPLSAYVRLYRIIHFRFDSAAVIPPKLYSPRPEHCLQFYPRDTEAVTYPTEALTVARKKVTLVGQHTVLQHRRVGNDFLSVQVVFQPAALYRVTGIDLSELANVYTDAEDVFGPAVRTVNEQLYGAPSYGAMIGVVERFLAGLMKRERKEASAVDASAAAMLAEEERFGVDAFLKESCLCHRQFDRKFKERVGIPPKQFLQVIRFDKAFRLKNRHPQLDWLSVAVRCGYHDYQHLAKDYKTFTGYTPPQFFALDNTAPERAFGDAET